MTRGVPVRRGDVDLPGNAITLAELSAGIPDTESIDVPRLLSGRQIGSARGRPLDSLSCFHAGGGVRPDSRLSCSEAVKVSARSDRFIPLGDRDVRG
jgi:hypothetical protein